MSDMERRLVSVNKACEIVGVSRRTIYNWLDCGKLQCCLTAGGRIRIYADSLFRPYEKPISAEAS